MPRPATKRNRPSTKAPLSSFKSTATHQANTENNDLESANAPKSPSSESQYATSSSRPVGNASVSDIAQQVKNQTPMSKSHEQAIESSPMGEHTATGCRPPTRARGYSSTLTLAGRKGDVSSKIPGTPAFESSILSNFRRRARQPSILQMMQTEDGSSDLDDDDFLGGLSPEDESTPLNVSRGKSLIIRHAASSSPESLSSPKDGSCKRKRATEELQVPQSPVGVVESTPIGSPVLEAEEPESRIHADAPRPVGSPEAFVRTMASPMSSSAPQSPARTDPVPPLDQASPATSGRTKDPSKQAPGDLGHLSTATLQSKLLPRRRQRRHKQQAATNFDPSNDDSEDGCLSVDRDDDELNYLPSKNRMKSQRKQMNKLKPLLINSQTKPEKQKKNVSKPKEGVTNCSTPRRAVDIDKENQPADMSSPLSSALDSDAFDSDGSSMSNSAGKFTSDELRKQAKKFMEVDKWQMDFEDVTSTTGSQGSPFR